MKILNSLFLISTILPGLVKGNDHALQVEQITQGPEHHFYGYIGHVQNIPWNGNERYIVALRSTFHDHLPGEGESADVLLIDTENNYAIEVVDESLGWNPQQGTMLYWNPESPDSQFFFNDRDPESGKIFTVLYLSLIHI